MDDVHIKSSELESEGQSFPLLGAINWLQFHGYTELEKGLSGDRTIFSRKSFCSLDFPSTHILIGWKTRKPHVRKTFALFMSDREQSIVLYAPEGAVPDGCATGGSDNTRWCRTLKWSICALDWLQDNGYVCQEKQMETRFEDHMDEVLLQGAYFNIFRTHQEIVNTF
jgi:hypothetical protein